MSIQKCSHCQSQPVQRQVLSDCEIMEKAFECKNPVTHSVFRQILQNRLAWRIKQGESHHCQHVQYRAFLMENHDLIPLEEELFKVLNH